MTNLSAVSTAADRPPVGYTSPKPVSGESRTAESATFAPPQPALSGSLKAGKVAPSPEVLAKAVNDLQHKIDAVSPELRFSIDKASGKTVVKLTDQTTNDVVWQFPSEDALKISQEIDRFQKGLLVNRKA